MTAYRPPFTRCANTPPAARPVSSACQKIIDTMDIDNAEAIFGARGVQGVRFELPMVLTDRESVFFFGFFFCFSPLAPYIHRSPQNSPFCALPVRFVAFSCHGLSVWRGG